MPRSGRPTVLTPAVQAKIAECFFLAFTDEQTALYTGINQKTIQRARAGQFCPAIKIAEVERERKYRLKIWNAKGFWQGAAWFLERKYPTQFAKPEIQLAVNTTNQTINNTLVVTAEVAGQMSDRVKAADAKVTELFERKNSQLKNGGNGHKTHKNS